MTWLPHPTYTDYEVSDDGRVRSIPRQVANRWGGHHWITGCELRTFARKGGYLGGNISVAGQRLNFELHRFVCETFHGLPTDPEAQVRHLNGQRTDNRATNLAWGSLSENMLDKLDHGTHHEATKTHCPAGHEYTEGNTYRAPSAPKKRHCRECMAIREAARPPRRR